MKYILFILILGFNSCSNDDFIDPFREYDFGTITALKNGEQWSAEIHGADSNGQFDYFSIGVNRYNQQGYRRENLSIQFIPKEVIKGTLVENCGLNCNYLFETGFRTISDDGDVICDTYRIVEELANENWIEITEFNSENKEFAGTFSATYAIDEQEKCNPNAPDTIRFTNGEFHSKITR